MNSRGIRAFPEHRLSIFQTSRMAFVLHWEGGGSAMTDLGKVLVFFGATLLVLGLLFVAIGRAHLPLGELPGDIIYRSKNGTFYFPLTTCILLSVVLSAVFYLINRLSR
jgi:hypothetical protein